MIELGSIKKLLEVRRETYTKQTNDILAKFSDRLTPAFQKVFENPDVKIVWKSIDAIDGTERAVTVSGHMALKIGDVISFEDKEIVIDETNVNVYNKFVKFAFPIIMLELATADELADHVTRLSKIGGSVEVTPERFAKILDKVAEDYEEKVLNDPSKLEVFDAATKPTSILGFNTNGLTDEQIRTLKLYENLEVETRN